MACPPYAHPMSVNIQALQTRVAVWPEGPLRSSHINSVEICLDNWELRDSLPYIGRWKCSQQNSLVYIIWQTWPLCIMQLKNTKLLLFNIYWIVLLLNLYISDMKVMTMFLMIILGSDQIYKYKPGTWRSEPFDTDAVVLKQGRQVNILCRFSVWK